MKREIKFRAWLTSLDEMFQPSNKDLCVFNDGTFEVGALDCKGGSLMQYTGLKDKNGVEIYESDIIRVDNENHRVFQEFGCWIYDHFIGTGDFHLSYFHDISINFTDHHHDCEIIGNIHENPELLK